MKTEKEIGKKALVELFAVVAALYEWELLHKDSKYIQILGEQVILQIGHFYADMGKEDFIKSGIANFGIESNLDVFRLAVTNVSMYLSCKHTENPMVKMVGDAILPHHPEKKIVLSFKQP